jgi:hypothetical protein
MRLVVVRLVQAAVLAMVVIAGVSMFRASTQVPTPVARTGGDVVIGPEGVGKLLLGMSEEQATATGQVRLSSDWTSKDKSTCMITTVNDMSYHFSRHYGLAVITVPDRFRTPEGVRAGASLTEVAVAYPRLSHPELGSPKEQVRLFGEFTVPVPDHPAAIYIFIFRVGGGTPPGGAQVRYVLLSLQDQGEECTHAT